MHVFIVNEKKKYSNEEQQRWSLENPDSADRRQQLSKNNTAFQPNIITQFKFWPNVGAKWNFIERRKSSQFWVGQQYQSCHK